MINDAQPFQRNLRLRVVAAFLLGLFALVLRDYIVNIRPHTMEFAVQQHLLDYRKGYTFLSALLAVVFTGSVLLQPLLQQTLNSISSRWKPWWTACVLAATAGALCGFMLLFSNRQFGAFDQSISVDTMWRQANGQIAYRDFITTNPPLYVLGLRLAAFLFGTNWDAQAWILCVFSAITLPWTYSMLRRLGLHRGSSMLLAVSSQVSGLVVLSFWWFNSITAVISGLFLLNALLLLRKEEDRFSQVSFVCSLALLSWTKANSAGLMTILLGGVLLLTVRRRQRLLLLATVALSLSVGTLWLCGIDARLVIRTYEGVARSRGLSFLAFGINPFFTAEAHFQLACLSVVLVAVLPALWRALCAHDTRSVGHWVVLTIGGGVGVFALASNGDLADVALAPVILAVGVAAFGTVNLRQRWIPMFYTGLFCAMLCTQMYKAESRMRIRVIGPYFAPKSEIVAIENPYFQHMRAGAEMNDKLAALHAALAHATRPVFFTSRLEWAYAALRLPSPKYLPVFYQAGTSFDSTREAVLLQRWKNMNFQTGIQPGRSRTAWKTGSRIQFHFRRNSRKITLVMTKPTLELWCGTEDIRWVLIHRSSRSHGQAQTFSALFDSVL